MNTKVTYTYRDANNFALVNKCVLDGKLTEGQKRTVLNLLELGGRFVPQAVGLPLTRFAGIGKQDVESAYLEDDGFSETEEKPSVSITPTTLVDAFRKVGGHWAKDKAVSIWQV